jgi:hypothetical protein
MASDDPVARTPPRPPEKLPLPGAIPGSKPATRPVATPFFIQLAQERANYFAGFDALRQNTRREHIKQIQSIRSSRVVVYYSLQQLIPRHAELLQDLVAMRAPVENLDLFLLSPGGFIDPAFKMVQICRAGTTKRFAALIPYYAKSAASLLCLGADELVMGPASEIGPTDPRIAVPDQYGRMVNISAVSIRDALDLLEERSKGSPEKALLFAPLLEKLDANIIGEYERALKSSEQFAEALLSKYMLKADLSKAKAVAEKLSTGYWSHGYPIDSREAHDTLGLNAINADENLWQIMWQLHKLYDAFIREAVPAPGQRLAAIFESEDAMFSELLKSSSEQPQADVAAEART